MLPVNLLYHIRPMQLHYRPRTLSHKLIMGHSCINGARASQHIQDTTLACHRKAFLCLLLHVALCDILACMTCEVFRLSVQWQFEFTPTSTESLGGQCTSRLHCSPELDMYRQDP